MIVALKESEPNVKLVLSAIEKVFNEHDIDAIDDFFSDNFVQHSSYVPAGGRRELTEWWRRTVEAIPDVHGIVEHVVAAQGVVAVFRTLKGTVKKDVPDLGLTASDQMLEFRVAHLFQVSGGKIVGHWETMDTGPAMMIAMKAV